MSELQPYVLWCDIRLEELVQDFTTSIGFPIAETRCWVAAIDARLYPKEIQIVMNRSGSTSEEAINNLVDAIVNEGYTVRYEHEK